MESDGKNGRYFFLKSNIHMVVGFTGSCQKLDKCPLQYKKTPDVIAAEGDDPHNQADEKLNHLRRQTAPIYTGRTNWGSSILVGVMLF